MFNSIDLHELATMEGPERAFLSIYLTNQDSIRAIEHRASNVARILDTEDERTHFHESMNMVRAFLAETPFKAASMCVFACWANDFLRAHHLEQPVEDLLWIGAAPYIRPLAELQDEYENFVVVAADNRESHVYFVTSAVPTEEERVKGDVKNRVKKGGWSQKRYARRRENELMHYATDVVGVLEDLEKRRRFARLILAGSDEAMQAIRERLPHSLEEKVVESRALDLHDGDGFWEQVFEAFEGEERASEIALWDRIRSEYLRGGRAAMGFGDVLEAALTGRVDTMIVRRDARKSGSRCRECSNVTGWETKVCPYCKSHEVFKTDLVEELVRLLEKTGGEVEFSDAMDGLTEMGDAAALLRY